MAKSALTSCWFASTLSLCFLLWMHCSSMFILQSVMKVFESESTCYFSKKVHLQNMLGSLESPKKKKKTCLKKKKPWCQTVEIFSSGLEEAAKRQTSRSPSTSCWPLEDSARRTSGSILLPSKQMSLRPSTSFSLSWVRWRGWFYRAELSTAEIHSAGYSLMFFKNLCGLHRTTVFMQLFFFSGSRVKGSVFVSGFVWVLRILENAPISVWCF